MWNNLIVRLSLRKKTIAESKLQVHPKWLLWNSVNKSTYRLNWNDHLSLSRHPWEESTFYWQRQKRRAETQIWVSSFKRKNLMTMPGWSRHTVGKSLEWGLEIWLLFQVLLYELVCHKYSKEKVLKQCPWGNTACGSPLAFSPASRKAFMMAGARAAILDLLWSWKWNIRPRQTEHRSSLLTLMREKSEFNRQISCW